MEILLRKWFLYHFIVVIMVRSAADSLQIHYLFCDDLLLLYHLSTTAVIIKIAASFSQHSTTVVVVISKLTFDSFE